jgi:glutaredoxin
MAPVVVALVMLSAAAPVSAASEGVTSQARALLDRGEYEKVLDVLGQATEPAAELAELLSRASVQALAKNDAALAALFCERALGRSPKHRLALETCVRVALAGGRSEDAQGYADRLGEIAPRDAGAALLRAEAARQDQNWRRVRELLLPHAKDPVASPRAAPLLEQADRVLREEKEALAQQEALERRLSEAIVKARALREEPAAEPAPAKDVILYSTRWCGACKRAREFLLERKIDFLERDIEREPDAAKELARKCARAGVRKGGVPVLDARGQILVGFHPQEYLDALR